MSVTPDLVEEYQLLDPKMPETQAFQERMERVQRRLLQSYPKTKGLRIHYAIIDSSEVNAAIMSGRSEPVVFFTKAMIDQCQDEDQLAAVLGHEFTHKEFFQRLGLHKNSNPEEASSDVWSVFALQKAGYRPAAMLEVINKFSEASYKSIIEKIYNAARRLSDPHPSKAVRRRNVENALAILEQKVELVSSSTPLSDADKKTYTSGHHTSQLQIQMRAANYSTMSTDEKAAFLEKLLFSTIDSVSSHNDTATLARISDISEKIDDLPRDNAIRNALPDKLLKASYFNHAGRTAIKHAFHNLPLPKNFKDIELNGVTLFEARNSQDALQAAIDFNKGVKQYPLDSNSYASEMVSSWKFFPRKTKFDLIYEVNRTGRAKLPWHDQALWGLESDDGKPILEALYRMGIRDPRFSFSMITTTTHSPDKDLDPADVLMDDNGFLTGFKSMRQNRFLAYNDYTDLVNAEYEHQKGRRNREEAAVAETDWSLLEKDFRAFVRQHREMLKPDFTIKPTEYPFAERFTQEVTALLQRKPAMRDTVYEFFFGPKESWLSRQFNRSETTDWTFIKSLRECSRSYPPSVRIRYDDHYLFLPKENPLVGFVMKDEFGLFNTNEKIKISLQTDFWSIVYNDKSPLHHRNILGLATPENPQDLFKNLAAIKSHQGWMESTGHMKTFLQRELYEYLDKGHEHYLDLARVGSITKVAYDNSQYLSDESNKNARVNFRKALEVQLATNLNYELKNDFALSSLLSSYLFYSKQDEKGLPFLLSRPDLLEKMEETLIQRLDALPNGSEKLKLSERLLIEGNPKNPAVRNWAIDVWSTQIAHKIDKGVHLFSSREATIRKTAEHVMDNTNLAQSLYMLSGLLDKTQAQEKESFYVRDRLYASALAQGTQGTSHLLAAANDTVLENLGDDARAQKLTLQFLLEPYEDKNSEQLIRYLEDSYNDSKIGKFMRDKDIGSDISHIPHAAKVHRMKMFHANFWAMPFGARTIYLERVLFPLNGGKSEFRNSTEYVMDKVMPVDKPYATEARMILKAYMQTVSPPLQRLILSALMTANDVSNKEGREMRPGQILSMVLGQSGPAGAKILQAVHSNDSTPEDIRNDVKDSKSDINRPFRWNIFERMREVMPGDARADVTKVCECLGAGAYGYTIRAEKGFGESAITLLRPNVEHEARYQFEKFRQTAESLAEEDPAWEPLIDIMSHARDMAAVEANFEIAARQIKQAGKHYDGLSVTVDGYKFDFSTARLKGHGMEFKETTLAKGTHFNDLASASAEEKAYKKAAAQALFTAEFYIICKGLPLDHDRHGAQQKLSGEKIVVFDHGAMMFDQKEMQAQYPTEDEKAAIGIILAETCNQVLLKGAPVVESLLENLKVAERNSASPDYFHAFKRAVLALNDFRRAMGDTPEEGNRKVMESIKAIVLTGNLDKTISDAALGHINPAIDLVGTAIMEENPVSITDQTGFALKQMFKNALVKRHLDQERKARVAAISNNPQR